MDNTDKLTTSGTQDEDKQNKNNPVYLYYPLFCLSSSCVPYVVSLSVLSIVLFIFVLCTVCCQFICIVHYFVYLRLVYRMLPVYLYCPLFCLSSSCVPYVASFSRLFLLCLSSTDNIRYTR
jgi:hypothetical protein